MSTQDNTKKLTSINSLCSILEFSGEGIRDFLNNLLISDVSKFQKNDLNYTALCNPKGRIIASFFINFHTSHKIYLLCPVDLSKNLINFFMMRKFRLKFSITEINSSLPEIYLPIDNPFPEIIESSTKSDFYFKLFELNLPWISKQQTEKHIPQHVNLDQHKNIMSFTKGCYPGQEIIARIKYLGKVKKRMTLKKSTNLETFKQAIINKEIVSPIISSKTQHFAQVICNV